MAKKTVVSFIRGDAPKPTKNSSGLITLRSPFPLTLKPQAWARIDFSMTCNFPLLVTGGLTSSDTVVFPAGQNIVCGVKNPSFTDDLILDIGTGVLTVIPVVSPEFEIE